MFWVFEAGRRKGPSHRHQKVGEPLQDQGLHF